MILSLERIEFIRASDGAVTLLLDHGDGMPAMPQFPMQQKDDPYAPSGAAWEKGQSLGAATHAISFGQRVKHPSHQAAESYRHTRPAAMPLRTRGKLRISIQDGDVFEYADARILACSVVKLIATEPTTITEYRGFAGQPTLVTANPYTAPTPTPGNPAALTSPAAAATPGNAQNIIAVNFATPGNAPALAPLAPSATPEQPPVLVPDIAPKVYPPMTISGTLSPDVNGLVKPWQLNSSGIMIYTTGGIDPSIITDGVVANASTDLWTIRRKVGGVYQNLRWHAASSRRPDLANNWFNANGAMPVGYPVFTVHYGDPGEIILPSAASIPGDAPAIVLPGSAAVPGNPSPMTPAGGAAADPGDPAQLVPPVSSQYLGDYLIPALPGHPGGWVIQYAPGVYTTGGVNPATMVNGLHVRAVSAFWQVNQKIGGVVQANYWRSTVPAYAVNPQNATYTTFADF